MAFAYYFSSLLCTKCTPPLALPLEIQQTNGPAEVMPNRDTEREPPTWVSNVFQSESGIGSDSTAQPGSVDEKNSGSIGGVAREGTKKEVTRTSPQEQNKEEEEESRGKYAAEGGKGEGVSKEVNGASSFQEAYRDVNSTSGLREEDDNKAAVFYPDKSKREADDPDCHAAVAREGRKLMASGEAQEEKDECLRKSVDGGQEETEGGNDGGKERGGSKAGGGEQEGSKGEGGKREESNGRAGVTSQESVDNSREAVAPNRKVRFDGFVNVDTETRSTQAQGTDIPANPEGDAAGKLSTSLSHGGSDEDEESLSGHQNEAAMQVTWRGQTVSLTKSIVITVNGSRLGQPLPEKRQAGKGEAEGHSRRKEGHTMSDGRNRQRKGRNRNVAAEESTNDVLFSSDEEGSDAQMPARGERKTSTDGPCIAERRCDRNAEDPRGSLTSPWPSRSARNVDKEKKRIGESRRYSNKAEEPSPAPQQFSEAKGEAAGSATLRSDQNNNFRHPHRRRQEVGDEVEIPVSQQGSPPSPTSDRRRGDDSGNRGSDGHGRTLSSLLTRRPVFFLNEPYLGPPVAACPRTWSRERNVMMVDSTEDCCRHHRRHRGRGRRRHHRISNSQESDTSRQARRRRSKSGARKAADGGGGGLRRRSSESKESSPRNRRCKSSTSSDSGRSSNSSSISSNSGSGSNSSSGGSFRGVGHQTRERPAEAKRGPTIRNREDKAGEERRPQSSCRRGSVRRTSTSGEEKGDC